MLLILSKFTSCEALYFNVMPLTLQMVFSTPVTELIDFYA